MFRFSVLVMPSVLLSGCLVLRLLSVLLRVPYVCPVSRVCVLSWSFLLCLLVSVGLYLLRPLGFLVLSRPSRLSVPCGSFAPACLSAWVRRAFCAVCSGARRCGSSVVSRVFCGCRSSVRAYLWSSVGVRVVVPLPRKTTKNIIERTSVAAGPVSRSW